MKHDPSSIGQIDKTYYTVYGNFATAVVINALGQFNEFSACLNY